MAQNILDLEHAAMEAALDEEDAATILFDFRAAFPSLARPFLFAVLEHYGLPPSAMNVVTALYLNTTAELLIHGSLYGSINFETGIRQGCPLSPLLFAMATDGLLRNVKGRHGTATIRAFADDTAVVLRSWGREGARLFKLFSVYGRLSCMQLNLAKTIAIPLWPEAPESIAARLSLSETAPQISWSRSGKYLGLYVGPGKGEKSWDKPFRKYLQRLGEWDWSAL